MDFSREFPLPNYPNINQKNIPDCIELTRIVDLIQHHEQTLRDLESRLEEAQRDRDSEEKRPKGQVSVMPTQDVHEIPKNSDHTYHEEALEKLEHQENKISQARSDLEMLRSAVHPIRRSPTDILQHIFTLVVMGVEPVERLKLANNLSHVCYRWRDVAINIPKFWSYIEVSLKHHPERIEWAWARSVERIRNCPAAIKIRDISNEDDAWEGMKKCRLDLISNIHLLHLSLDSSDGAERLASGELFLPKCIIGTLQIEKNRNLPEDTTLSADLSRILNRFLPPKSLWIRGFDFDHFTAQITFPDIPTLSILRSTNVSLGLLAKCFPNLEGILFWKTNFRPHHGEAILWPKLNTFNPYSTEGIPWRRLELPKLRQLVLPNLSSPEGVVERLSAYHSLRHFHSPKLIGCSSDIITNAPGVACFSLPALEAVTILKIPYLAALRLVQTSSDDLSCELLEEIICKHFMPSRQFTREEKQIDIDVGHPKRFLKISVPKHVHFEFQWGGSPLLPISLEESLEKEFWLDIYRTYCFTWD